MFSKMIDWWNDEEQVILRHEMWRTQNLLFSRFGVVLVILHLLLTLLSRFIALWWLKVQMVGYLGAAWAAYDMLIDPLIRNLVWIGLFYCYVVKRVQGSQREQLLVTPMTPSMLWPALLATPLFWALIAALIHFPTRSFIWYVVERASYRPFAGNFHALGDLSFILLLSAVAALRLSARTNLIRICIIVIVSNFLFNIILMLPLYGLASGLMYRIAGQTWLWTEGSYALGLLWLFVLQISIGVLLLRRLRRTKGLEAFALEDVQSLRVSGTTINL